MGVLVKLNKTCDEFVRFSFGMNIWVLRRSPGVVLVLNLRPTASQKCSTIVQTVRENNRAQHASAVPLSAMKICP